MTGLQYKLTAEVQTFVVSIIIFFAHRVRYNVCMHVVVESVLEMMMHMHIGHRCKLCVSMSCIHPLSVLYWRHSGDRLTLSPSKLSWTERQLTFANTVCMPSTHTFYLYNIACTDTSVHGVSKR